MNKPWRQEPSKFLFKNFLFAKLPLCAPLSLYGATSIYLPNLCFSISMWLASPPLFLPCWSPKLLPLKDYLVFSWTFFFTSPTITFFNFPNTLLLFFLLYSMVTQLHIHVFILFSLIIMLHPKWLDIVPSEDGLKERQILADYSVLLGLSHGYMLSKFAFSPPICLMST